MVWLRLNNVLASIGLIEPHFKISDYKRLGDRYVDIDVDMIQMSSTLAKNTDYLKRWSTAISKALGPKYKSFAKRLQCELHDEFLFKKLMEEL